MSNTPLHHRARLIVVTGRPGSGKTMVAHALARAIRCPAICRDEIKEGLVKSLTLVAARPDASLDAAQRHASETFFKMVELLLRDGVTLVAEAAFQNKVWAPRIKPLLGIATVRIIICTIDPQLARARFTERGVADPQRERFHGNDSSLITSYDPPRLDVPTLVVDTTDGYRPVFDEIVAFARASH